MTRRDLSDAQLDAIAAAPREERTLPARIARLQDDYRTEAALGQLTTVAPPVTRHAIEYAPGKFDVEMEEEPADANGRNLSGELVTLIGGIIGGHDRDRCSQCSESSKIYDQETSYGPYQPVRRALTQWERKCRRLHGRWPDHRGRPVCAEIAWNVIREETSIEWAADQVAVSFPRAERLLKVALDYIERGVARTAEPVESHHDRDACPICRAA